MENPPTDPPLPARPARRLMPGARFAHWAKELVTVFVGVYAAFALNGYQVHRQERQRRAQILEWALREYGETLTFVVAQSARLRTTADTFDRQVKANEMPVLHAFNFRSDYNPNDFTSMLQSGGFDLLDVETVRELRVVEGSLRQLLEVIRHDQQLSDALILPHLDEQPGVFYNPVTKQLRSSYAWYAEYFPMQLGILGQMQTDLDKLLTHLRAERDRNR